MDIQDAAGANAYHIPQGILLNYEPKQRSVSSIDRSWKPVSVLDFAPSILRQFGIKNKS